MAFQKRSTFYHSSPKLTKREACSFLHIMTWAKYKTLYKECNKYVLIAINAKQFTIVNGSPCFYVVLIAI